MGRIGAANTGYCGSTTGGRRACSQVWTIRVRLLKVGAVIRQSVRRVKISLSSAFPLKEVWATALRNIAEAREDLAM